jgi:ribosomal protein S18 acetylase RimI-like enzyme
MIPYTIRKATPDDLQLAYDIRKNALGEYVKQTWGWDEDWQWKYHLEDFDTNILSIIEVDGNAAATLEEIEKEDSILVSGIYILDKYQSNGIGRDIMKSIMAKAERLNKSVKLQVLKVNTRAKEFYLSLGFSVFGENETHYQMILEPKNKL